MESLVELPEAEVETVPHHCQVSQAAPVLDQLPEAVTVAAVVAAALARALVGLANAGGASAGAGVNSKCWRRWRRRWCGQQGLAALARARCEWQKPAARARAQV